MTMHTEFERAPAGLRQHLQRLMEDRGAPGLQIAAVRDGKIEMLDSLGLANLEHQVPVTDQSIFSINSMSKAFTGIAVMQLVEDGKLDLSAPIATYLSGLPEAWQQITVLQLATLTSGVPEMMVYTADFNVTLIGDGSEEGAWDAAYAAPMEYPTGRGYRYTQTNYALLGKIIGAVSGCHFTKFIAERQFAVAGMTDTHYVTDRDIVRNRANSYMNITAEGAPAGEMFNSVLNWPTVLQTAAGLHSTAKDLANWVIALKQGNLLSPESIGILNQAVAFHDGRPGIWGIGWLQGKSGGGIVPCPAGGAKAQLVLYPDGLALILLTNLIGAFPEHLAPVTGDYIDLSFMDAIAGHLGS